MGKPKKLSPALLILLLALVFALLIFALGTIRFDSFSDWLGGLFLDEPDIPENNNDLHYEALLEQLREPNAQPVPIDSMTLAEAFTHYAFDASYRHIYTVTYHDGTREAAYTVALDRTDEQYQLSLYRGTGTKEENLLYGGQLSNSAFRTYDGMDNRHLYASGRDFPYYSVVLQPNPEGILEMLRSYEADPAQSPLSACTVTLEMTARGRRLVVACTERETGETGEYAYLLDYGVLESASAVRGGVTWYTLTTQSISPTSGLENNPQ